MDHILVVNNNYSQQSNHSTVNWNNKIIIISECYFTSKQWDNEAMYKHTNNQPTQSLTHKNKRRKKKNQLTRSNDWVFHQFLGYRAQELFWHVTGLRVFAGDHGLECCSSPTKDFIPVSKSRWRRQKVTAIIWHIQQDKTNNGGASQPFFSHHRSLKVIIHNGHPYTTTSLDVKIFQTSCTLYYLCAVIMLGFTLHEVLLEIPVFSIQQSHVFYTSIFHVNETFYKH